MPDDTQVTVQLVTFPSNVPTTLPFLATRDGSGEYSLQSTPRVAGAQVDIGNPLPTTPGQLTPLGYQQITDLSGTVALTVPSGATRAVISIEGSAARWRDDGQNPTSTVGMPLAAGAPVWLYCGNLAAIRFIGTNSACVLNASYYR